MNYFLPALQLLFIGLKLTGYIAWSWGWVLFPLWIMLTFAVLIYALVFFVLHRVAKREGANLSDVWMELKKGKTYTWGRRG